MRYSKQREAVLRVLKSTYSHPDAEWIYNRVKAEIPNISLGTVYRNLRELSESGELVTLETESGSLHFDADTSSHAHFVCKQCGKISDLFGYDGNLGETLEHVGYKVENIKTVVYGICPDCAARKNNDTCLS